MAEEQTTHATAEVPAGGGEHHAARGVFDPAMQMVVLTWVTFGLLAFVLYKMAWKPILAGLEKREGDLRKAVDEANRIREELAQIDEKRRAIISEADGKAKDIVDAARAAATEAASAIENRAREESQIMLENAQREIHAERDKAIASLRKETADLAIGISRKVIGENLDEHRSRELVDRILRKM